jgi:hypothetical protein
VFSVDTEEEAKTLIVLACPRDVEGNYYARELVVEQNLANLRKFSDKLALAWSYMQKANKKKRSKRR